MSEPVVILVYDGAAGDETGALVEILSAGGVDVILASVEASPVTSYHGRLVPKRAPAAFDEIAALIVPGGMGVQHASHDQALLDALQTMAARSTWLGATSTGSVLLAAAGLADGANVTTHWLARDLIDDEHHTRVVNDGFVEYGRLLTASGLASTANLAFRLVGALRGGEAEQEVRAQYQPRPARDTRYERDRRRWWSKLGSRTTSRKQVTSVAHVADPDGDAEMVVIDFGSDVTDW